MNSSRPDPTESSSRRFLLLPEDDIRSPARAARRPQVRRYRLASIGRGADLGGTDLAVARIAGEFGRLRSYR
jgi:hypothetical protein